MTVPSIAIVGSGPSGCYVAQALRKAWADAPISLFERLPVPYGLARYGVAPDHPGTKAVTNQFARLFERENIRFCGNLEIGRDITLNELREHFDVVVLTLGLAGDSRLGIPGDQLPGVYGAGQLTRLLNDHPDEVDTAPVLGERIAIIGNGNVAIDLIRLLSKKADEFAGSDLSPQSLAWLQAQPVREIDVIGRSPAAQAKCDTVMLRELGKLNHACFSLADDALLGEPQSPAEQARLDAFKALIEREQPAEGVTIRLHFGKVPQAIIGQQQVEGLRMTATQNGAEQTLDIDNLITAIGFNQHPQQTLHRDQLCGDADLNLGRLDQGLYCAGWLRRGPRGTIPENRADARLVADAIIAAVNSGRLPLGKPGELPLPAHCVSYQAWQQIDRRELEQAGPQRTRQKLRSRADMLAAARTQ
ncbi:FAD-dependent oxidoreductase [Pseudomonas sp. TTU2014-080ASC]|uniref:FAD-dependent oxidoreductase n=1 Tax=Pseudomonas sp. TTU2014-080ASC TaxID=1729724 RepID=UPI0007187013|nr:FAD-dependent oxidoreductase [Pseudomonas sp. TTU2014-080ASC]KRW58814.1 oxidoreductase [Pseudomonas sp. TTU2014-080ASC]